MAKVAETEERPTRPRVFNGHPVRADVVNIGTGGTIEFNGTDPETPDGAFVWLKCRARVGAGKWKATEDGGVDLATILTIDATTFEILSVEPPPPDPQPTLDEGLADAMAEHPSGFDKAAETMAGVEAETDEKQDGDEVARKRAAAAKVKSST